MLAPGVSFFSISATNSLKSIAFTDSSIPCSLSGMLVIVDRQSAMCYLGLESCFREVEMQAYCVKCRKKVEIKNPKSITMKNKRPATQGECPSCGTKVFRIGKS